MEMLEKGLRIVRRRGQKTHPEQSVIMERRFKRILRLLRRGDCDGVTEAIDFLATLTSFDHAIIEAATKFCKSFARS